MKEILAIDLDDTLVDFVQGFCDESNARGWTEDLTREGFSEDWFGLWGLDRNTSAGLAEYNRRVEAFYESDVYWNLNPVEGAQEGLSSVSESYRIVILTSRMLMGEEAAFHAVDTHFTGLVEDVMLTKFYDNDVASGHDLTKGVLLSGLGAVGLIDDHVKHVNSAVIYGHTGVLFGNHPWSRDLPLHPKAADIHTWPGVVEYLDV